MLPRHVASRSTSERLTKETLEKCLASLTIPMRLSPTAIQFSSDSRLLYVHDGEHLHAWTVPELCDHECHHLAEAEQGCCRFLNDQESVMLIGSDSGSEEGIHHVAFRSLPRYELNSVADIHLETYGLFTVLFTASNDQLLLQDYGQTGYFFRLPYMEQFRTIKLKHMRGIIFSPNESELWTTGGDGVSNRDYLNAFDVETGKPLRRQAFETSQFLYGLRLAKKQSELLVVGEKTLFVLDPQTWELLRVVDVPAKWEMSQPVLAFSPTSPLTALSSDSNNGIYLINHKTWEIVGQLEIHDAYWAARCLAFSPDGKYLARASWDNFNEVRLWDFSQSTATQT